MLEYDDGGAGSVISASLTEASIMSAQSAATKAIDEYDQFFIHIRNSINQIITDWAYETLPKLDAMRSALGQMNTTDARKTLTDEQINTRLKDGLNALKGLKDKGKFFVGDELTMDDYRSKLGGLIALISIAAAIPAVDLDGNAQVVKSAPFPPK